MPNNPNAIKNLKPIKKGERRNPKGRPKNFVDASLDELKAKGYEPITPGQVAGIYQTIVALSRDDMAKLAANDKAPMISRIIAKGILGNKGFDMIEKMLDRAQGRPTSRNEVTGKDGGAIEFVPLLGADSIKKDKAE